MTADSQDGALQAAGGDVEKIRGFVGASIATGQLVPFIHLRGSAVHVALRRLRVTVASWARP